MSDIAFRTVQDNVVSPKDDVVSRRYRLAVLSREEVMQCRHWARAFAAERKDHRYYELVEDTIRQGFDYRYFAIQDANGEVRAVQPFFLLDQDLLAGTSDGIKKVAGFIRRFWPRFMLQRTLMVGCAAGEGHLDSNGELPRHLHAQLLAAGIADHARQLKASLIVLKEFPAADRPALGSFLRHGYTRVPSLPMTRASLQYASFDEYMNKVLSRNMRSKLRRKFKASEQVGPLDMSVVRDVTPIIDDVYPLYLNVYERAKLRFEKLTKDFLCGLGRRMPDKVRFFIWRHGGKIVAFNLCMIEGVSICSEYIGLDYNVAFDFHLYYIVVRDVMAWAMARSYRYYFSTALNYEPKFHMRYSLVPLDLYVKHTWPIFNFALKYMLPLLEPTRYDKILRQFPNYDELRSVNTGGRSWVKRLRAMARAKARKIFARIWPRPNRSKPAGLSNI